MTKLIHTMSMPRCTCAVGDLEPFDTFAIDGHTWMVLIRRNEAVQAIDVLMESLDDFPNDTIVRPTWCQIEITLGQEDRT